jgi:hypothetical protein
MFRNVSRRKGAGRLYTDRSLRYAAGNKNYYEGANAISRTIPEIAATIQTAGTTRDIIFQAPVVEAPEVDCTEILEIYNTVKQHLESVRDVFSSKYKPVATVIGELQAL